jgi:hypothetical protein
MAMDKAKVLDRLEILRKLSENHGGEGEGAPIQKTFDIAADFVSQMICRIQPCASMTDLGCAALEIEDRKTGFYADMVFQSTGMIDCYMRGKEMLYLDASRANGWLREIGL